MRGAPGPGAQQQARHHRPGRQGRLGNAAAEGVPKQEGRCPQGRGHRVRDLSSSSSRPTRALPGTDRRRPRPHSTLSESPPTLWPRPRASHAHRSRKRSVDSKTGFLSQGSWEYILKQSSFPFTELDRNQSQRKETLKPEICQGLVSRDREHFKLPCLLRKEHDQHSPHGSRFIEQ